MNLTALKKGAGAALAAVSLAVLSACGGKVSAPQQSPPAAQGRGYLLTLKVGGGDSRERVQQTYGGQILAWQPESGFAIVQLSDKETERVRASALAGKVSLQSTSLEPNLAVDSPEAQAQGSSAWAGGSSAWAGGWSAWAGGWSAWAGGNTSAIPSPLPDQNMGAWNQISLYGAHGVSRKFGSGVKVAVIDTGLDTAHPMFSGRLAPAAEWRDFIDNDNNPQEVLGGRASGHGTAVAGLILQVAPKATILPIRVLNSAGGGDVAQIVNAINYAVDDGAQVINVSIGATGYSSALYTISSYAKTKGVRIVASAGNDGKSEGVTSPAQFSWLSNTYAFVTGIGSVDDKDLLSSFSNYGSSLYATAPGEKLYTAFPASQVANATGTSFAAPLFTGAIALAYSEMPNPADRARIQDFLWNSLDFSVNGKNKNKSTNVQRLNIEKLIRSLPGFTLPATVQPGVYALVNTSSGKCLDVEAASTASGANVQQWACHYGANQQWRIEAVGSGYKLTSVNSGKTLDVAGGPAATGAGANVDQADYTSSLNQQWLIQPNGSDYQVVAAHSNKCLDVAYGGTADGANVWQWDCNNTSAQSWKLMALF